jgi:uncharacterized protein with PQ loop repeat
METEEEKKNSCPSCPPCQDKNGNGFWSFGSLGVILNIIGMLPQLALVHRTKSTVSLDLTWMILALLANLAWLTYGIRHNSLPNIVSSIFFAGAYIYLISMKRKYNGNG